MTVTERERRRMELVDGSANRTDLCELLAMREYELDEAQSTISNLKWVLKEIWTSCPVHISDCEQCEHYVREYDGPEYCEMLGYLVEAGVIA